MRQANYIIKYFNLLKNLNIGQNNQLIFGGGGQGINQDRDRIPMELIVSSN
jgi:hypothetical protein